MSTRRKPEPYFVETHGFEKRFFEKSFKQYFGESVEWADSVDMATGQEGLQLYSPLQHEVKKVLIDAMRQGALKYHRRLLQERERGNSIVDWSPRLAAARNSHLNLFPPLQEIVAQHAPSATATNALASLPRRRCRSTPASPSQDSFSSISALSVASDPSVTARNESQVEFYDEQEGYFNRPDVPELRLSRAPTLNPPWAPLRTSRSIGDVGANRFFIA